MRLPCDGASTWEYNTNGNVASSYSYKKEGDEFYRKWDHTYYAKNEKSKSIVSNSKGKVLGTWSYDCKQEGEKLEKKKDETQVCRYDETTAGLLIMVTENFDEKGRITKMVRKFTRLDTLPLEVAHYDYQERPISIATYDSSYKRLLNYKNYKRGKIYSETINEFENERIVSSIVKYNEKFYTKKEYAYNDDGLLATLAMRNKKNKLTRRNEFSYLK